MRFFDFLKNVNFCRQRTSGLNDSLNTYIANEICRVYAFPIPKSFREMEKIDRNAQHGDYPTLLSYSPRKQAAASARYTVYQFAIQSSRSLECSLKLLHPNLVFTSFAQFRMNPYMRVYIHACTYICTNKYIYTHTHICIYTLARRYTFVSNFSFPEESAYPLRTRTGLPRNREIRRLRGLLLRGMRKISERNGIKMGERGAAYSIGSPLITGTFVRRYRKSFANHACNSLVA